MDGVDNAVQDRISEGGIGDTQMPVGHRGLVGENDGSVSEEIVEDFEQILDTGGGDSIAPPFVEDEQVRFGQRV